MSKDNSFIDTLGNLALLYYFRIPIIILLILFVIGYYKFAVPVHKEYDEKMSKFNYSDIWIIDSTTNEVVTYNELNPTRREIAMSLEDSGYVLPENKEKIEKLSDELIVKTLGGTYRLEEANKDGNMYYTYYIGSIRMEGKQYTAFYTDQLLYEKYKKDSGEK